MTPFQVPCYKPITSAQLANQCASQLVPTTTVPTPLRSVPLHDRNLTAALPALFALTSVGLSVLVPPRFASRLRVQVYAAECVEYYVRSLLGKC